MKEYVAIRKKDGEFCAIDMLVRCIDCRFWEETGMKIGIGKCHLSEKGRAAWDFCSFAVARLKDEDD